VLRSSTKLSTDERGLRSATPIDIKDTDAIVRGSNAEIEQETIEIARPAGGETLR
jgi:hypothetical protein